MFGSVKRALQNRFSIEQQFLREQGYTILDHLSSDLFCRVYKVEKDGTPRIIKYADARYTYVLQGPTLTHIRKERRVSYYDKMQHVRNESAVLDEIKDVAGVVQKIRDFEMPIPWYRIVKDFSITEKVLYGHLRRTQALEKEYIEGSFLADEETIEDPGHQDFLYETVLALHDRKIANLDIKRANIIMAPTRPYLFDFGTVPWLPPDGPTLEQYKAGDLRKLEKLCA